MTDPLDYPCTACSAAVGVPCHDRAFNVCEPHMGRRRLAGLT